MIFDKINKLRQYDIVSDKVLDFLFNLDENTPEGRYDIDEKTYVNVETYETKSHEICFPEAHKRYIDIQVVLSGHERLDFDNIEKLTVKQEYNEERDVMFFEIPERMNSVNLSKGYFAMLYPHDAHRPQMRITDEPEKVKKAVIKILVV